jgi:signal peptide peptidase SppA
MDIPRIAQRIFNRPLAIAPEKAEIIVSALEGRFGFPITHEFDAAVGSAIHPNEDETAYHVEHGIAIIPVTGTLVHKSGWITPMSGMTGYDTIRHNLSAALQDPAVRGIAFDIDSPGGEVAGCFDLCDMIYSVRGEKPMMAILSDMAFSAAYAIASAADIITVPECGGTGSVGVVACHADYSRRLSAEGVKITMIHYGAKKVDGNETMPLTDSALSRLQADVDKMGAMFVKRVARNRKMTFKAVRDTEAGVFLGREGVDIGFADEVLAPEHAFEAFVSMIG